jgi:hypothetical protein
MAKKLENSEWRVYFDLISKALTGKRAEIEVASLKLGDQIEAEWLPLFGISYDPRRRQQQRRMGMINNAGTIRAHTRSPEILRNELRISSGP